MIARDMAGGIRAKVREMQEQSFKKELLLSKSIGPAV
jgi:hypothetical protein